MIPKNELTPDEILTKLDETSRKTRAISIALTVLLFSILAVVSYLTYSTLNRLTIAKEDLANVQIQANEERDTIEGIRKEKRYLSNTLEKVNDSLAANANVNEAKNILANANNRTSETPIPTASPNTQKTPNNANMPANTTIPVNNSPSTVYVQIVEQSQRASAKQLIQKLTGENFRFSGIELVERKITKTHIRYFHAEDKNRAAELAEQLQKAGIEATIVFTNLRAEKHLLEIWFSNDAFNR